MATETNKSVIIDHVAKENHVIYWSGVKILDIGRHDNSREYIHIRKGQNCMNRDGGDYDL